MNWTLSFDGHTLALAKKHRAPLAADILLLDLQGGKQRTLLLGNWFSIAVWILLGWAIPSPNGRDVAIWMSAASSNAYLLEDF